MTFLTLFFISRFHCKNVALLKHKISAITERNEKLE